MDERIKQVNGAIYNIDLTSQWKVDWKRSGMLTTVIFQGETEK